MAKQQERTEARDVILSLLSAFGLRALSNYILVIYSQVTLLAASQIPQNTFRLLVWLSFALFLIGGLLVRKYLLVGDIYKRWFTIFWIALLIGDLISIVGMLYNFI